MIIMIIILTIVMIFFCMVIHKNGGIDECADVDDKDQNNLQGDDDVDGHGDVDIDDHGVGVVNDNSDVDDNGY